MPVKVLACRVCGGELEVSVGGKIARCKYCGQAVNIPCLDDRLIVQYNRGTFLRQKHDFENAYRVYQRIVAEYPNEAEAYWGLVLCRYGIDYVDDNGRKVPTLHRMQYQSVLKDGDYQKLLECTDRESKELYQSSANEIYSIQQKYMEVIHNEKPYDVFICYKDTEITVPGKPSIDRTYAQEIYDVLTGKGYKVFFSHVTLEKHLGIEYEPYIFAALNTARVMLLVGTSREKLESTWVKNEWSRYLDIIQMDPDKKLIPVFRDMEAYDLPKELVLKNIQGINYGELGALQQIEERVHHILSIPSTLMAQVNDLLLAAKADLKVGAYDKARSQYEQVLQRDGKNFEAALGLLLIDLKLRDEKELPTYDWAIDKGDHWSLAMECANEKQRKWLENCLEKNAVHINYELPLQKIKTWKDENLYKTHLVPQDFNEYNYNIRKLVNIVDYQDAAMELSIVIHQLFVNCNRNVNVDKLSVRKLYNNLREIQDCTRCHDMNQQLRILLEECASNTDNIIALEILSDTISACREQENKISDILAKLNRADTRRKLKKIICILAAVALTIFGIFVHDPNTLMFIVPVALFFLLSLHQVEPTAGHFILRVLLCMPYAFFTWRIATATSTFSLILRCVIWGLVGGALFQWGILFLLFEHESEDRIR